MTKLHIIFATLCLFLIAIFCIYRGYDTFLVITCVGGIAGLSGYEIRKNGVK